MTISAQEHTAHMACAQCGIHRSIRDYPISGLYFCYACAFTCDLCDEVYLRSPSAGNLPEHTLEESCTTLIGTCSGSAHACDMCADNARSCDRCGELFTESALDREENCDSCASAIEDEREEQEREERERRASVIGSYHSSERKNATRLIHGEWSRKHGGRLFGTEVEVECGARVEQAEAARAVLNAAHEFDWNYEPLSRRVLFCEADGSLDDGFEMITQPMGMDAQRALWNRVLNTRAVRNLRSHDTNTCGLHVHVSRTGLSELTIAKVVCFMNAESTDRFITLIARRNGNGYCKVKPVDKVKGSLRNSWDRYERVNLTNRSTIEFRIFRGTTNYRTLMGSIEFTHAVLEFCAQASVQDLTLEAFAAWLYRPEQKADTLELRYLIARRMDAPIRARIARFIPAHKPKPTTATES